MKKRKLPVSASSVACIGTCEHALRQKPQQTVAGSPPWYGKNLPPSRSTHDLEDMFWGMLSPGEMAREHLKALVRSMDPGGTGKIGLRELVTYVRSRQGTGGAGQAGRAAETSLKRQGGVIAFRMFFVDYCESRTRGRPRSDPGLRTMNHLARPCEEGALTSGCLGCDLLRPRRGVLFVFLR